MCGWKMIGCLKNSLQIGKNWKKQGEIGNLTGI